MKVVYDDQLNADLARVLSEGKEFIAIISPYIKLSSRIKDILKQTAKNNNSIKLMVVFGKNESSPNKSLQRSDLDFFINEFKDISIYYKDRLHAKCYVNERMGMITSMNLYDYSIEHNLELGVFFENTGFLDGLIKQTNMAIDYLSSQKSSTIEGQVYNYINHVKESSKCIYEKTAIFQDKYFGLSNEYLKSEVKTDILNSFFKKYVDNETDIIEKVNSNLSEKEIKKTTTKKSSSPEKAKKVVVKKVTPIKKVENRKPTVKKNTEKISHRTKK